MTALGLADLSSNKGRTPENEFDDLSDLGRSREIPLDDGEKIFDFALVDAHVLGSPFERDVRGSDQGEVAFVGVDENHALVAVLKQIGLVAAPEFTRDNMAALDEPDATRGVSACPMQNVFDPGAGSVDKNLSGRLENVSVSRASQIDMPCLGDAPRRCERRPRQHRAAAFADVQGVQDNQPRVVYPAVRIFEGAGKILPQRLALRHFYEVEASSRGQDFAPAQVIVEKEACPDHPGRALLRAVRKDKPHRPDDVRRRAEQDLALDQRLADEAKLIIFEIAQAAVNKLARPGGGSLREIVLLAEQHRESAADSVASDAGSVDAAANDNQIELAKVSGHSVWERLNKD